MSQLPSVELQSKTPTYRKRGGELTLLATTFMYSLYVWCTVGELYCTMYRVYSLMWDGEGGGGG